MVSEVDETAYLFRSEANKERLLRAVENVEKGENLIEIQGGESPMKRVIFESGAFQEFTGWAVQDKKIYAKIVELIRDIDRSPFTGLAT